jgi:hypothetical protein
MIGEGFEDLKPEHYTPMSERDPSLPDFKFLPNEREDMKKKRGLTDIQIDALEVEKTNLMIQKAIENKNRKKAA